MKFMKLKKFAQKTISLLCAAAVTCSIVPVFAEGEKETDNMHITEKTYTFYADTINSDGSLGRNEWGVTSVPQFFYVDTVDVDKIESITIRSGYENGNAEVSVYTYDNGNKPLSQTQLQGLTSDNEGLTKIGSVATSKNAQYGYSTAVVTASEVTLTENAEVESVAAFTLDTAKSQKLAVPSESNSKALVVGISGEIGAKAYFDYIKINYSEPVYDKIPDITGIEGEGIISSNVEIDKINRTITIPVLNGTDLTTLNPTIAIDSRATAAKTEGTWDNGKITVTFGDKTAEWIVTTEVCTALKQYLTASFCVSHEGTTDQTNGSLGGTPQIKVSANTTAKLVIEAAYLKSFNYARISYAQSGGTLNVKLSAAETADTDATEIVSFTETAETGFHTRETEPKNLTAADLSGKNYLIVEFTPTSDSYIDFVDFFAEETEEPTLPDITDPEIAVLTSLSNGKAIASSGNANGNVIIAAKEIRTAAQQWKMEEGAEKGWYNIINVSSNRGIGMSGGTLNAGEQPIQWAVNGSADQYWRFMPIEKEGKTYYKIINKNSKLVLTMGDSKVTQETWTGEDNQLWIANIKAGTDFAYGSKYEENYAVSAITLRASDNKITYTVMCTKADSMYLEVKLSGSDAVKNEAKGEFAITQDGTYTITASIYEDSTKAVKVCDDFSKEITITNGGYEVIGADWICSTEGAEWTDSGTLETRAVDSEAVEAIKAADKDYIIVDQNTRYQEMDATPWGGCFNEMGWEFLMQLDPEYKPNFTLTKEEGGKKYFEVANGDSAVVEYKDLKPKQKEVIDLLYKPGYGLSFTTGRTPIGSSDFGLDMYTYDDVSSPDYNMEHFSTARDDKHLIPYIKAAETAAGKDIPIFSSPWTAPAWMKTNGRLNGKTAGNPYIKATIVNGKADETTDKMFKAYAKYFVKYLEEYHDKGIDIKALTPQNEPTMNTPYPSTVWNGDQLNVFLRDYLCPAVAEYNETYKNERPRVEVWLGTFTDSNQSMVWPTFKDAATSKMVDGYCFQWWGAPLATKLYAQAKADKEPAKTETVEQGKVNPVKMIQSESKCGGGSNDWTYAEEQFDCYKEFLDAGINQYHLWNMILDDNTGHNNALPYDRRWAQCAPITIDVNTHEYHVNPQFYMVKHFSANVKPYARRIKTEGKNLGEGSVSNHVQDIRAISFQNTDGEIVVNVKNSTAANKDITVVVNDKAFDVTVPAHSINTFSLDGEYKNTPDATEYVQGNDTTNVKITNAAAGDLLSAEGYVNGGTVNLTTNKGESTQTWKLVASAKHSGFYHLENFETNLGIAVWSGSVDPGADIKQYENTGAEDQQWKLEFVEYRGTGAERKAYYKIVNYKSQLSLSLREEGQEGTVLTQKAYDGSADQLWTLEVVGGEWEFPEDTEKPDDPKPGLEAKTETQVTPDGNNYTLTTKLLNNVPTGSAVIVAAYKADGTLLNIKTGMTASEDITTEFIGIENISYFKIMVWNTLSEMKPVTKAERKDISLQ